MPPIPLADNFLAGSLLSILLPLGLLIALAIWYVLAVRRVPDGKPRRSAGPAPVTESSAGPAASAAASPGAAAPDAEPPAREQ